MVEKAKKSKKGLKGIDKALSSKMSYKKSKASGEYVEIETNTPSNQQGYFKQSFVNEKKKNKSWLSTW